MAKKARTAAQKKADAKRSREMKGKKPSFMRKRAARKSARKAARATSPRRRRRMTKTKTHGRRKGTVLTPKNMIIAAPAVIGVAAGLKQIWDSYSADKDAAHAVTGITMAGGKPTFDKNVGLGLLTKVGGGVVASKGLKIGLGVATKAAPILNKVLNAKIARV